MIIHLSRITINSLSLRCQLGLNTTDFDFLSNTNLITTNILTTKIKLMLGTIHLYQITIDSSSLKYQLGLLTLIF